MAGLVFVCTDTTGIKYGEDIPRYCPLFTMNSNCTLSYESLMSLKLDFPHRYVKKWQVCDNMLCVFTEDSWKDALDKIQKKKTKIRDPNRGMKGIQGEPGSLGWCSSLGNIYKKNISKTPIKGEYYGGVLENGELTAEPLWEMWDRDTRRAWIQSMIVKYGKKHIIDKEELSHLHLQKSLGPTWVKSTTGSFAPSPIRYIGKASKGYTIPKGKPLEEIFEIYKLLGLAEMFSFYRKDHNLFLENYVKLYTDRYIL